MSSVTPNNVTPTDVKTTDVKTNPWISQNVWLKGVGGMILLIAFLPVGEGTKKILISVFIFVCIMAVITHAVKLIKMFVKSVWNS